MATVGFIADPEDKKIGSKITVINILSEESAPLRTYYSYRFYVNELFSLTQENLKGRFRQGLGSHIAFEDWLGSKYNLPSGACRGLHLISLNRKEVEAIVSNSYCQELFKDPVSYIELHLTENRHCIRATFRQPAPTGITKVIDLLHLIREETGQKQK